MKTVGATLTLFCVWCCTKSDIVRVEPEKAPFFNKGDIGFYENNHSSKTSLSDNGVSVVWDNGDEVKVWAADSKDSLHLKAQTFKVFAGSGLGRSYFTSALESAMEEGTYRYVACYPAPSSIDSTTISFRLPSKQDGTLDGIDFMLTEPVEAGRLKPLEKVEDYSFLSFNFKHKFHILRFFIPSDHEGAEKGLSEFSFRMPTNIVGAYCCDVYKQDEDSYISEEGPSDKVDMELATPLMPSTGARQYAYAAIIPFQSKEGDRLRFSADTINVKTSFNTIDLEGRNFQAGHMTSVPVRPVIADVRDFSFKYLKNELGEPMRFIRLKGPEGLVWAESGTNIYDIPNEADSLAYETEVTARYSISRELYNSKNVTITAELRSDHFAYKTPVVLNAESIDDFHISAEGAVPQLLAQDFAQVPKFSSSDNGSTGYDAGSKSAYKFLNGWTAARAGADEGKCIRIAARRERLLLEARYPARADSQPLSAEIIAPVDLVLEFDYGTNRNNTLAQTIHVGYVNDAKAYASGESTGTYVYDIKDGASTKDGSFNSTPNHCVVELNELPAKEVTRISWRSEAASKSGSGNITTYFYLDNVKVSIKKEEVSE